MQLQEANAQLKKAEGILNGHSSNLDAMNDKLSASDENSNLSAGALKILLKDNAKEIRKLWDITNKANKPNIDKNIKSISSVKALVAKVDKKATGIDKKVTGIDKKVISANSKISGNKKSIAALKSSLAKSQDALEAKFEQVKSSVNEFHRTLF